MAPSGGGVVQIADVVAGLMRSGPRPGTHFPCKQIQKVSAMAQIVLRTAVVTCLASAWLTMPASSQTGTESDGPMASVRVDCGAFKRIMDGSWVTTKDTTVYAGLNDATAGWITFPPGAGINQNVWRPNGVDLLDVLNQKCPHE
jgi:hypothetical protein